ncbi:MAG: hypothetical protein APF76_15180 [Desulfitibacter sp. BRH_c19]|nr:MAG: hypothetical protein APF76_15180 [Desulfitibacter sp. BRH_c19]
MDNLKIYTKQAQEAIEGLLEVARLEVEEIVVIGCSTSEVAGKRIGTSSSLEIARAIMEGIFPAVQGKGIFMAVQCCEHLNRALVVEKQCAKKYALEVVSAIPHEKAGGSLPTVALGKFTDPVLVETISGHAGMDIGDTFIGMHLKMVAVPVRLDIKSIGSAHLTVARTRPKFIGGERACY